MKIDITDDSIRIEMAGDGEEIDSRVREVKLADLVMEGSHSDILALSSIVQLAELNARLGSVGEPEGENQERALSGVMGSTFATQQLTRLLVAGQATVISELQQLRKTLEQISTAAATTTQTSIEGAVKSAETLIGSMLDRTGARG